MKIGLLALQGAVGPHAEILASIGATTVEIRRPAELDDVDALVIPGGESTTMARLLVTSGLFDPLIERLASGMCAMGTCAGMIMLASTVLDGRPDQRSLAAIDIGVRRNAFGRQIDSFECPLEVSGLTGTFPGVFIRAPFVEEVGSGVSVGATVGDHPVLCSTDQILVTAFHPELTDDQRVHRMFLEMVEQ